MSTTHQAPLAFSAAQAYLKSIESAFAELEGHVRRRNDGGTDAVTSSPGELAPIVSGIAFAIELFLKVLQIQDRSNAGRGHDLIELWEPLSPDIKLRLETRYLVALDAGKTREGIPFVLINVGDAPLIDHNPAPTFEEAARRVGRSFERWRYLYELIRGPGGYLYFNFAEANAMVTAVREEILEFPGNAIVQMTRNQAE